MMSLFISSCVIGLDGSLRVNVNSVPVSGGRISDGQLCLTEGTLSLDIILKCICLRWRSLSIAAAHVLLEE